jgi:hypothetical protein
MRGLVTLTAYEKRLQRATFLGIDLARAIDVLGSQCLPAHESRRHNPQPLPMRQSPRCRCGTRPYTRPKRAVGLSPVRDRSHAATLAGHGVVLLVLFESPKLTLRAGRAGARPVHPILRHSKIADGLPLFVEERSWGEHRRKTVSDPKRLSRQLSPSGNGRGSFLPRSAIGRTNQ